MEEITFAFNGAPPPIEHTESMMAELVKACLANPGEWASVECASRIKANSRRDKLKKKGLDATVRLSTLYVRAPL